jgi:hypothetical protein
VSSATFHVNLERSLPDFRQGWTVLSSFSPDVRPNTLCWNILSITR